MVRSGPVKEGEVDFYLGTLLADNIAEVDPGLVPRREIEIVWWDISGRPSYSQPRPFKPGRSILSRNTEPYAGTRGLG